jgi:hypothetical protein
MRMPVFPEKNQAAILTSDSRLLTPLLINDGEIMSTIKLYKENSNTYKNEILGTITAAQLDFLIENLEAEFEEDEEYFLNPDTFDYLKEQGADNALLALLKKALTDAIDGVDIIYQIDDSDKTP